MVATNRPVPRPGQGTVLQHCFVLATPPLQRALHTGSAAGTRAAGAGAGAAASSGSKAALLLAATVSTRRALRGPATRGRVPRGQAEVATRESTAAPTVKNGKKAPTVKNFAQTDGQCSAPAWRDRYWFPVASPDELDPARPTPVQIDGLRLVVWKVPGESGEDEWRILDDACAHRLAPLSEGRIEPKTGCLQCAYHGWEFDGSGACQKIPQTTAEKSDVMCRNSRSSVKAYPTEVALGVLWAWLGEGPPKGHARDVVQGTHLEDGADIVTTYTRDLPYGYDFLVENLMDVSHIPFAHHGLQGTRDDAAPISMSIPKVQKKGHDGPELLSFNFDDATMGMDRHAEFQLQSPFLLVYKGEMMPNSKTENKGPEMRNQHHSEDGGQPTRPFRLNVITVPVKPGWSRAIIVNPRKRDVGKRGKSLKLKIFQAMPRWALHLLSNRFLDSDLAFLHYQERCLRRRGSWEKGYYMPAESDRSISAWRRWITAEGALCVAAGSDARLLPPTPSTRAELLDRFSQHTAHCVHCRKGLVDLARWQRKAGAVGVASFVLDRLGIGHPLPWVILQITTAALVAGMQRLKKEFHFVDYEHYKT